MITWDRKNKMSEDIYSQYLRFAVTESAAATFTEGSAILTGASVNRVQGQNIALEIRAISAQLPTPQDLPSTGATESVIFSLSTRSALAATPNMDDEHVLYMQGVAVKAGAATYLPLIMRTDQYMPSYVEFDPPLLISHTKLYPYIVSSNSSVAAAMFGFILFTYVLLDADLAIEALEAFR